MDFLTCSKLLLAKTRRVLISDSASPDPAAPPGQDSAPAASNTPAPRVGGAMSLGNKKNDVATAAAAAAVANPLEQNYIIWQTEMERGFEALVQSILPYIRDHLAEAAADQFQLSSK